MPPTCVINKKEREKMGYKNDDIRAEIADQMGCDGNSESMEIDAEMELRTLFFITEDAVEMHGFKVIDGDEESVIVRNSKLDMDFGISIKQLVEDKVFQKGREDMGKTENSGQEEFSTLFSIIEDAVAMYGFKVMDGDDESIIVRNSELDMDFEISIERLVE